MFLWNKTNVIGEAKLDSLLGGFCYLSTGGTTTTSLKFKRSEHRVPTTAGR